MLIKINSAPTWGEHQGCSQNTFFQLFLLYCSSLSGMNEVRFRIPYVPSAIAVSTYGNQNLILSGFKTNRVKYFQSTLWISFFATKYSCEPVPLFSKIFRIFFVTIKTNWQVRNQSGCEMKKIVVVQRSSYILHISSHKAAIPRITRNIGLKLGLSAEQVKKPYSLILVVI